MHFHPKYHNFFVLGMEKKKRSFFVTLLIKHSWIYITFQLKIGLLSNNIQIWKTAITTDVFQSIW